jgi:hypothetical protein
LAIPVLVVLALLWAAFFLWPLVSHRSSERRVDSIGDFSYRLGVIGRTGGHTRRRRRTQDAIPVAMPRTPPPARPLGAPDPRATTAIARQAAVAGLPRPAGPTRSQRRRRDVLLVLGVGVLSSLLLALVAGNPLFWVVQGLTDLLLVGYLVLLVRMKRVENERRAKVHYLPAPAAAPLVLRRSSVSS